ncbi:MAG TPA: zinc-binding dehydrogenase [Candidatus Limnocylindrales bacterium]|nr:zinc-binding dehydrogenase [Candidatus Limnocylindrales bacterium]
MKAIVIREFGAPEVMHLEDVGEPKAPPGEIVIKVHAVSVNRTLDCVVRAGKYPVTIQMPHVLGVDPAGAVVKVGSGVSRFKIGDRVATISLIRCGKCKQCAHGVEANCLASRHIGLHRWGGYAEYVSVPERNAFHIADNLTYAEGTVITRHYPMAFNLLTGKTQVRAGEWVLVMGATGALGSCCVQVAKMFGARVIAAAGADARVAIAINNGADFGINYRTQDLAKKVMALTDGDGVDIVCESIADPSLWPGAFNSLAIGGRMVTAGAHGGGNVMLDVKRLYLRRISILGAAGTNPADVDRALEAARAGRIKAIPHRVMPLSEAAEAHRIVENNQIIGKIVLEPGND